MSRLRVAAACAVVLLVGFLPRAGASTPSPVGLAKYSAYYMSSGVQLGGTSAIVEPVQLTGSLVLRTSTDVVTITIAGFQCPPTDPYTLPPCGRHTVAMTGTAIHGNGTHALTGWCSVPFAPSPPIRPIACWGQLAQVGFFSVKVQVTATPTPTVLPGLSPFGLISCGSDQVPWNLLGPLCLVFSPTNQDLTPYNGVYQQL